MLLVLGLKGIQYNLKNDTVIDEFYPDNLFLDVPDYTDAENLDEILINLAQEWFSEETGRKSELAKMLGNRVNTDYYITNIMVGGKIYSMDDPLYRSIFDSIGIIHSS